MAQNDMQDIPDSFHGLCDECSQGMFTCDVGHCNNCGEMTSSGAFKHCLRCAHNDLKCMCCEKDLPKPSED